jgi:hypothetical protein
MVKAGNRQLPSGFGVAIGTLSPQRGFVLVIFFMAGNTLLACLLEHDPFMACVAFHLRMLPI